MKTSTERRAKLRRLCREEVAPGRWTNTDVAYPALDLLDDFDELLGENAELLARLDAAAFGASRLRARLSSCHRLLERVFSTLDPEEWLAREIQEELLACDKAGECPGEATRP